MLGTGYLIRVVQDAIVHRSYPTVLQSPEALQSIPATQHNLNGASPRRNSPGNIDDVGGTPIPSECIIHMPPDQMVDEVAIYPTTIGIRPHRAGFIGLHPTEPVKFAVFKITNCYGAPFYERKVGSTLRDATSLFWIDFPDDVPSRTEVTLSFEEPTAQSVPEVDKNNPKAEPGSAQPATKPEDKQPVKGQPSTPTPKNAPR